MTYAQQMSSLYRAEDSRLDPPCNKVADDAWDLHCEAEQICERLLLIAERHATDAERYRDKGYVVSLSWIVEQLRWIEQNH